MPNIEHPITLGIVSSFKLCQEIQCIVTQEAFLFYDRRFYQLVSKKEYKEAFKKGIKTWKPENCIYRLCRIFVQTLVFYE